MTKRGTRIGVAAFALGLSFAGPQAVGVASAESPDSEPGPQSTGPDSAESGGTPTKRTARTGSPGPRSSEAGPRPAAAEQGSVAAVAATVMPW